MHAQVSIAGFLDGEVIIVCSGGSDKVIRVRLRSISYAKVINDETESGIQGFVLKEAGSLRALMIAVFG